MPIWRLRGRAALAGLLAPAAQAQMDPHQHHRMMAPAPAAGGAPASAPVAAPMDHSAHTHDVGPAGSTYDLRFIDGMVQHHTGALRMSEFVFEIGVPGVGSLGKEIWFDQAQEIKAMGQWRKAWYPQAPVHPVVLRPGGDPNSLAGLQRMDAEQVAAMQMVGSPPSPASRVTWFLEGMIEHHGGALQMAHDALRNSTNPTIQRLARQIIVAQRREIRDLRSMLRLAQ